MTKRSVRKSEGVTIVELVITIAITAIVATAFARVLVPMVNFYFYYPENMRVMNAAADVLEIIIEGDPLAEGLRYTGPPCAIPTGGSSHITTATASTLTYNYAKADSCGGGGTSSKSVALAYDSVNHVVTRSIDGGTATTVPSYATAASGIKIDAPVSTSFFSYYKLNGGLTACDTAWVAGVDALTDICQVNISVNATSGTGLVKHSAGQALLESAVEIKRYTT